VAAGESIEARSESERARSLYETKGYLPGIERIERLLDTSSDDT